MACINPHRLSLTGAIESAFAIKVDRSPIGEKDVLMKVLVSLLKRLHQMRPDALALVFRKHKQMRIENNQVAV